MGRSQIAGAFNVPRVVGHLERQIDVRRHRGIDRPKQFRQRRPHGGPTTLRLRTAKVASRATLERIVPTFGADQRANDRKLVHHGGHARHHLADLDTGHIRVDGIELAANFRRRIGFQIEHILMRRSAGQEDHDHRFVRRRRSALLLRCENLRQRQSTQRQTAKLQERTSRHAIAHSQGSTRNRQHLVTPL